MQVCPSATDDNARRGHLSRGSLPSHQPDHRCHPQEHPRLPPHDRVLEQESPCIQRRHGGCPGLGPTRKARPGKTEQRCRHEPTVEQSKTIQPDALVELPGENREAPGRVGKGGPRSRPGEDLLLQQLTVLSHPPAHSQEDMEVVGGDRPGARVEQSDPQCAPEEQRPDGHARRDVRKGRRHAAAPRFPPPQSAPSRFAAPSPGPPPGHG